MGEAKTAVEVRVVEETAEGHREVAAAAAEMRVELETVVMETAMGAGVKVEVTRVVATTERVGKGAAAMAAVEMATAAKVEGARAVVATAQAAMRVEVMAAAETAEVAAASIPRLQTHHSPDPCSSSPQSRPRRVARLCSP